MSKIDINVHAFGNIYLLRDVLDTVLEEGTDKDFETICECLNKYAGTITKICDEVNKLVDTFEGPIVPETKDLEN